MTKFNKVFRIIGIMTFTLALAMNINLSYTGNIVISYKNAEAQFMTPLNPESGPGVISAFVDWWNSTTYDAKLIEATLTDGETDFSLNTPWGGISISSNDGYTWIDKCYICIDGNTYAHCWEIPTPRCKDLS